MIKAKFLLFFIVPAFFLTRAYARPAQEEPAPPPLVKIGGIFPGGGRPWVKAANWEAAQAAALAEMDSGRNGEPALDFRLVTVSSDEEEIQRIQELLSWGARYLVILPSAAGTDLVGALYDAYKQGVRIVAAASVFPGAGFLDASVSADYAAAGALAGGWFAGEMKAEGLANYAVINAGESPAAKMRLNGFFAAMEGERSLVNLLGGREALSIGRGAGEMEKAAAGLLRRFPKVDALYIGDDDLLPEARAAIESSPRKVRLLLGGGGAAEAIGLIRSGDRLVKATVLDPPSVAAEAVRMAAALASGDENAAVNVTLPSALVTAEDSGEYEGY
jgi:ribose transport system substrate-binding protein